MELTGQVQNYDWGRRGDHSKVAELFRNVNPEFVVDSSKPYAELWFGTHASGASIVKNEGRSLLTVIQEKPDFLGSKVKNKFGQDDLPFLFKVLSIEKALSIQVHPDKLKAEELNKKYPGVYKDSNHKPEIAIALTTFEALCGFRPYQEIKTFFKNVPELEELVGKELSSNFINSKTVEQGKSNLRECFRSMMTQSHECVSRLLSNYLERVRKLSDDRRGEQLAHLVERLNSQFPDDVGCFAVFFFNYMRLQPYQAIFLEANLPHAYLSGDCVECMACSDNVVRAGLTPKFKDVETLCSILNYEGKSADSMVFKPNRENLYTEMFKPPVPDFAVAKIEISQSQRECTLITRETASILLTISGNAKANQIALIPGSAVFIPAYENVVLADVSDNFLAFQAVANV